MPRISTDNYDTVASWNGSEDLFVVEQQDGTKVATPAMVKQFIQAGDFEATGEIKDGHGNILKDMAKSADVNNALSQKLNKVSIQGGRGVFPAAAVGDQIASVSFPVAFAHTPKVVVSWDDTPALPSFFKYPLLVRGIDANGFQVQAERLNASSNWYFRWIAVDDQ